MKLGILVHVFAIVGAILLGEGLEINSAAAEAGRWKEIIVSNKNFINFFSLIMVGVVGGFISSRYKAKPKVRFSIMISTWIAMYAVGFVIFQSTAVPLS